MMKVDIHGDLLLLPVPGGVRLIKPEAPLQSKLMRLNDVFSLPISSFFVTQDGEQFIDMNDHLNSHISSTLGYSSRNDLKGRSLSSVYRMTADLIQNSKKVVASKQMHIFDEKVFRIDNLDFSSIVFKIPCYDFENKMLGLFGFSIINNNELFPTHSSIAKSLDLINNMRLFSAKHQPIDLQSFISHKMLDGIYLTTQEITCLKYLIRGMTAKMIAKSMHMSYRTIESYVEKMKLKFQVASKSALIEKVISYLECS